MPKIVSSAEKKSGQNNSEVKKPQPQMAPLPETSYHLLAANPYTENAALPLLSLSASVHFAPCMPVLPCLQANTGVWRALPSPPALGEPSWARQHRVPVGLKGFLLSNYVVFSWISTTLLTTNGPKGDILGHLCPWGETVHVINSNPLLKTECHVWKWELSVYCHNGPLAG